ncbi:MAG: helix-turn-helix transcriptional regulator [Methylococcales bacterium]|jgi:transcriptional regulator with XRE-family HTH domain|nr:helix-turn-helix transcriptional regulator [Methylococcales bacterium]
MLIHEKMRFFRLQNGWSQEYMADKLGISVNGYGGIERGETDMSLSRLRQITNVLGVRKCDLCDCSQTTPSNRELNSGCEKTTGQNNRIYSNCSFNNNEASCDYLMLKNELEKQIIINEKQARENELLNEINQLLKQGLVAEFSQ